MPFTISDDLSHPPHHIVRVAGELDVTTAPELRAHLLTLLEDGRVAIAVDLDPLEFMDSSGLGVLVTALKRAQSLDGDIALICSNEHRLKLLRVTGLNSVFAIYDNVDALIAG